MCETCATFATRGRFDMRHVKQNNLGGQGPDEGEEVLIFERVAKTNKTQWVDLRVKAISSYAAEHAKDVNGAGGAPQFGIIAVSTEVTEENKGHVQTVLEFEFLDSDTQEHAEFDFFTFGVFDIDHNKQTTMHETICLDLDQAIAVRDTNIPGLKLQEEAGKLKVEKLAPRKHPDAGLVPGFKDEQLLSTYDPSKTCEGSSSSGLGSVRVFSNQVGFACDEAQYAFVTEHLVPCTDCTKEKHCAVAESGMSKFFGQVYAQGTDKAGQTCDNIKDLHCTDTHGINTAARALTIGFSKASKFRIAFGIECEKPIGQFCNRKFNFGGLKPGCVICDDGFEPDGTGLCKGVSAC